MTDLWFRNVDRAMTACVNEGVSRISWTRQHLARMGFDGITFVRQFYLASPVRPKIRIVGIQGTADYDIFSRLDQPKAVYPTWSGKGDNFNDLVDLLESNVGEDEAKCNDKSVPQALRPVFGQKHIVSITNCPVPNSGYGKTFWLTLANIQSDYPHVELFMNGTSSFAALFGLKFKSVDFGLCDAGDINRNIVLPNGVRVNLNQKADIERLFKFEDWVKMTGFTLDQVVKDQYTRFQFRIRAARWAAAYWEKNLRFHSVYKNIAPDQIDLSDDDFEPAQGGRQLFRRGKFTLADADKVLCNRCRIQPGCKAYREDSICGLKESKVADLEKFFQSRNAGQIIEGLAGIVRIQAKRTEAAMEAETASGESDPEVTKQLNSLFANGVKLAQLVDPNLKGGPKVQVNVAAAGNAQVVASASPRHVVADIVSALEARGIARDKITPEMITGALQGMAAGNSQPAALEAQAISFESMFPDLGKKPAVVESTVVEAESVPVERGK